MAGRRQREKEMHNGAVKCGVKMCASVQCASAQGSAVAVQCSAVPCAAMPVRTTSAPFSARKLPQAASCAAVDRRTSAQTGRPATVSSPAVQSTLTLSLSLTQPLSLTPSFFLTRWRPARYPSRNHCSPTAMRCNTATAPPALPRFFPRIASPVRAGTAASLAGPRGQRRWR